MYELSELMERRKSEELRLAQQLKPIAMNFPYSLEEVRSTYDLLRRRFSESESVDKTRRVCEIACASGCAPSMLVLL